jgi:hypothetical protein
MGSLRRGAGVTPARRQELRKFGIVMAVNTLSGDITLALITAVIIALFVAMPLAGSFSSQE